MIRLFLSVLFLWSVVIIGTVFWALTGVKFNSFILSIPFSFLIALIVYKIKEKLQYNISNEKLGIYKMEIKN